MRQPYGIPRPLNLIRILAGTPTFVGAINIVVFGVFAALVAVTFGASDVAAITVGIIAALVAAFGFGLLAYNSITGTIRAYHPRFPQ